MPTRETQTPPYGTRAAALVATKPLYWNIFPTSTAIVAGAANQFRGCFITIPVKTTISKARIRVASQTGNLSVAVYNQAGTARLLTTGAVACPAAGNATLSFTTTATLDPGVYFVGLSDDNGAATYMGTGTYAQLFGGSVTTSGHPAPATVTVDDASAATTISIGLF